jgi:hypothetical protein
MVLVLLGFNLCAAENQHLAETSVRLVLPADTTPVLRNLGTVLTRHIQQRCDAKVGTRGEANLMVELAIELGTTLNAAPEPGRPPISDLFPPSSFAHLNGKQEQEGREFLSLLNRQHAADQAGNSELEARIAAYELAARLQLSAPEVTDIQAESATTQSLSLVRFDGNDYSVPTKFAHQKVTAIGSIEEVRLIVNDQLVAKHPRDWSKEQVHYDPVHYLALLERKPGALNFAKPLENWDLPGCFDLLRRRLEAEDDKQKSASHGRREYIKTLRLLETIPLHALTKAIERALEIDVLTVDAIRLLVQQGIEEPTKWFRLDHHPHLQSHWIPPPKLSGYDELISAETNHCTAVTGGAL